MDDLIPLDLLGAAAAKWPERVALRFGAESWTFAELDYAATEIAGRVPATERVAFRAEMSVASIVAAWGIPRGGGVAVPIDPSLDAAAAAKAATGLGATLGWPSPAPDRPKSEPLPSDPVFVISTSGSSASPRGVIITSGNVEAAAAASQLHLGTRESDVWLLAMPLHHIAGLAILWRATHDGAAVVLHSGFGAGPFAASLRASATWTSVVPTMLRRILDEPGDWPGVRGVLVGGAHAATDLVARANAAGLAALPTYGMTETTSQACTVRPGNSAAAAGTVGHPLPGVQVSVDAQPGEPGEILIEGPTVSPGYVDEPERRGAVTTNDIGYFDASGRLVVVGRKDDVIVTGGEKVHPLRVEAALRTVSGVADAVVFGTPDQEWGERVVAVVVARELSEEAVRSGVAPSLPRFAVPTVVKIVAALPLLSNGKIDRLQTKRRFDPASDAD